MELKEVIGLLNQFLRGWGNYFHTGNAAGTYGLKGGWGNGSALRAPRP